MLVVLYHLAEAGLLQPVLGLGKGVGSTAVPGAHQQGGAAGPFRGVDLLRSDFVDPDARNVRVALSKLYCLLKVLGVDDVVAGDGLYSPR